MRLSILIPTLERRRELQESLCRELDGQIARAGLEGEVEVLTLRDDGSMPVGRKRNLLVERASGAYLAHVDDDDEISPEYVPSIVAALVAQPDLTHLGIRGHISFRGRHKRPFVMSNRHTGYRTRKGCYLRPPHHLNPVRADIAARFRFEEVRSAEDSDWAMRLVRAGTLDREHMLDLPIYHYRSRRPWPYELLLDSTEFVRHPLGLQLWNRHRVRRFLRELGRNHRGSEG